MNEIDRQRRQGDPMPEVNQDMLATWACQRGKKKATCTCDSCKARLSIFGANLAVPQQEERRAALRAGKIEALTQEAPCLP